ncbi:hypothetical protein MSG28_011437 [Choristoneura fumiferana]|uniref:Uncharacterized protein n=1 Tax=Choristoneura fumiferana TaxID=7141 RepID=A0ACC0JNZ8_CHOFU|nr:hypothetical protein MSG28_011437 [Choristoneura fumiferana]
MARLVTVILPYILARTYLGTYRRQFPPPQKADIMAGRRIFVNNYLAEHRRISVQSGGSSLPALSPVSHQSDD